MKASRGTLRMAARTAASWMPRAAICVSTIASRCAARSASLSRDSTLAAGRARNVAFLLVRLQPRQLGGVEVVLAARRAVVHRQAQVLVGLHHVAELPVGHAEPEVELVVVIG